MGGRREVSTDGTSAVENVVAVAGETLVLTVFVAVSRGNVVVVSLGNTPYALATVMLGAVKTSAFTYGSAFRASCTAFVAIFPANAGDGGAT